MFEMLDVKAGYGSVQVLHGVTLTVPERTVVALLGPNGAGKTTLLRVASGLLRPTSGVVAVDGASLAGQLAHDHARRGICHVPEGRGIFRTMTVRDNILLGAGAAPNTQALDTAAEIFPVLGARANQIAGTLSGGEQQMLALVRAYLSSPRFVFLDEVSLGLAPKIVDEIFEFLTRLVHEGASLLLVEQYVVRALQIADLVYVLDRGRIVFAGEPDELDQEAMLATYVGAGV